LFCIIELFYSTTLHLYLLWWGF